MIDFSSGKERHGYIVNAQLLHAILMWVDVKFAYDIYTFLEQYRKNEIAHLQKRYVVDDKEQQWSYVFKVKKLDDKVLLQSSFNRCQYKDKDDIANKIYYIRNLPNGFTFRYNAFERIMSVIEEYGGKSEGNQRSSFSIPLENWDDNDSRFDWKIRNALKQTRLDLHW